jgi:hypothetical protein
MAMEKQGEIHNCLSWPDAINSGGRLWNGIFPGIAGRRTPAWLVDAQLQKRVANTMAAILFMKISPLFVSLI